MKDTLQHTTKAAYKLECLRAILKSKHFILITEPKKFELKKDLIIDGQVYVYGRAKE